MYLNVNRYKKNATGNVCRIAGNTKFWVLIYACHTFPEAQSSASFAEAESCRAPLLNRKSLVSGHKNGNTECVYSSIWKN